MKRAGWILAACLLAATGTATAQTSTSKPIRLIVPFAPGGSSDTVARLIAGPLGDALQRTIVVENRSGAGGAIGTDAVAKAPPDGDTLLVAFDSHTLLPVVNKTLGYDAENDFVPISQLTAAPLLVTVNPRVPAHTIPELIAVAKQTPGGLNFGSVPASATHFAGLLFKIVTGAPLVHVSYRGGAPAVTDLLAGQLQVIFAGPQVVTQHIKQGNLRAIAATSKERFSLMPDLPTVAEAGYPDYAVATWTGLLAPAKTPPAIVKRYEAEAIKVIRSKEIVDRLHALGLEVVGSNSEQFGAFIHNEIARWRQVVAQTGLTLEQQ